jgi:hypothetical protein
MRLDFDSIYIALSDSGTSTASSKLFFSVLSSSFSTTKFWTFSPEFSLFWPRILSYSTSELLDCYLSLYCAMKSPVFEKEFILRASFAYFFLYFLLSLFFFFLSLFFYRAIFSNFLNLTKSDCFFSSLLSFSCWIWAAISYGPVRNTA